MCQCPDSQWCFSHLKFRRKNIFNFIEKCQISIQRLLWYQTNSNSKNSSAKLSDVQLFPLVMWESNIFLYMKQNNRVVLITSHTLFLYPPVSWILFIYWGVIFILFILFIRTLVQYMIYALLLRTVTVTWKKKMWYILTMESYCAIQNDTLESLLWLWMHLEIISEVNKIQKLKCHIVSLTWET